MIGTGGSALVSMTLGEGKERKANEYFSMLIAFVSVVGVILTVGGIAVIRPVFVLLGAEGELLEGCVVYGTVLMLGLVPFILQGVFASFLVTAERPKLGLKFPLRQESPIWRWTIFLFMCSGGGCRGQRRQR